MVRAVTARESPAISAPVAGLLGVLATAVAVGVGHLLSGFVQPDSSPVLAVGNTFVDLTPGWLKDFAINTFGRNDKNALLTSIALVMLLLAVASGLLSRRTRRPGMIIIGLFGLLGFGAVVGRPDFQPTWLLPPIAAITVGLGSFAWLHGLASAAAADRTAGTSGPSRRAFLRSSVAVAVAAGGTGFGGQLLSQRSNATASRDAVARMLPRPPSPLVPLGADFAADGTPGYFTPNNQFYRIDTALTVPRIQADKWQMTVHGMVQRQLTVGFNDLLRRDLVTRPITLTCVSNEVNGPLISTAVFTGVELAPLLREAGPRPGADQLLSTSVDGWTAGTPLDVLLEPGRGALLAVAMNGEPLPAEHGYPVRMVVPGLYGFVSATKWLTDLELTTFAARRAYWLDRGWARTAPIKTQSRIDRPRGFQVVPAGSFTAAGIAWAQPHGIEGVEVRLDDGPWRPATLSTEVTGNTWRMWRADLRVAPGSHFISCRATDRRGRRQPDEPTPPVPDGAQGWPVINFTAR